MSSVERTMKPVAISDRPAAPATRTPTRAAIAGDLRESGMTTSAIGSERAGRLERRVAQHELEVRERQEEEAEGGEELDGDREGAGAEAAPEEVAAGRASARRRRSSQRRKRERRRRRRRARRRSRIAPAALGPFDDAEDERRERREPRAASPTGSSRGGRASRVAGTIASVPTSATAARTTLRTKIDGHGEPLEQHARGEQAEHAAARGDPDPRADGLAALLRREDGRDHGQRHGHDRTPRRRPWRREARSAAPGLFSEDGRERREAEEAEPGGEDRLAADAVADRAGGQEQRREGERVRVDDPLQLRLRGAGARARSRAARRSGWRRRRRPSSARGT